MLIACTQGRQVQFTLTLSQGGVTGTGHGAAVCATAVSLAQGVVQGATHPARFGGGPLASQC